ncbi:flavin-containing monooxygenase [Pseudomonas turukhanskensis]|uniref:4-hydroxyacetophenone monooxygenase n=1 Tax=Pseudomonas turukhanskensis TaxID=1806536 RepID=A0A9W6KAA0_9PSED|nr:NAD(P)/FAD-dependent oxidoreductase [Pseudomonas turukhanskensis]GLK91131.1 4-hydroxyacetophenone monooxygenase [Pseudomonas turukhanskensis]
MLHTAKSSYDIVILGAGFGGLGMAAQLKMQGIDNFIILERGNRIGGVWRDNAYPGAACDTESHLYCYSFYPHLRVSKMYADRDELLRYMDTLAEHYALMPHIKLGSELTQARWDETAQHWAFELADGARLQGRFFVPAWGQLNKPAIPAFKGLDNFAGQYFHSAQWPADAQLAGKKVASIGAAASAVQYVPEVAKEAAHLTVFQRSANWIMPRNQMVFSQQQLDAYSAQPELFHESRRDLHAFRENGFARTRHGTDAQQEGIKLASAHLAGQVPDLTLRAKLTPDYEFACKRILRSDDYYPALTRSNVSLETTAVDHFVPEGIVDKNGALHEFDVVIFGTGFESQAFQGDLEVIGRKGRTLHERWQSGAEAYLGMTVPGFPNMFMIYGPNTNLNHNSIITMLEIQQRYIIEAVQHLDGQAADVRDDAFNAYNDALQANMQSSAFSSDCSSWYKNAAGKVINNWSGTVEEYRALANHWHADDYHLLRVSERAEVTS